uniref:hypothetical protein n=1 Tax=Pasteurella multocida TaxID=747 RepID=UPI00403E1B45
MKQIVLKTSLLMTLSSLLVACSGGGGSAGNRADRVEEKAQPVQSNSLLPLQSKILLIPLRMILFMTNFQCLLMTHPKKIVNNPPLKPL